jgi:DNA replication protein DnaC
VHELIEARDDKRLLRLQRRLAGYKLLIIDELGYVPLSQTGAELLFEVFSQRYERGATIVTSNLPFDVAGKTTRGLESFPAIEEYKGKATMSDHAGESREDRLNHVHGIERL